MSTESRSDTSGLTLRSAAASLLVITLAGVVGHIAGVFDTANTFIGTEALPVPALLVFWPLAAVAAGVGALARTRIFSRAELVVVLLASLIATPLMTVGFWRYQLAALSTVELLPELDQAWGYPFAIALMVASVAAPFIYFRRKGWLR